MRPTGDIIRGIQVFRREIDSPYFAFSFAKVRHYLSFGLDPLSSRIARRFPWPAMVFSTSFAISADARAEHLLGNEINSQGT